MVISISIDVGELTEAYCTLTQVVKCRTGKDRTSSVDESILTKLLVSRLDRSPETGFSKVQGVIPWTSQLVVRFENGASIALLLLTLGDEFTRAESDEAANASTTLAQCAALAG